MLISTCNDTFNYSITVFNRPELTWTVVIWLTLTKFNTIVYALLTISYWTLTKSNLLSSVTDRRATANELCMKPVLHSVLSHLRFYAKYSGRWLGNPPFVLGVFLLFWSAIVQSCIVCFKTESHLPFVSTKHLEMKVSLLSKQRISAQPPETRETHKGPFLSPLLHQHHSCHTITLRFINYSNATWARALTDNSRNLFTDQRQNMAKHEISALAVHGPLKESPADSQACGQIYIFMQYYYYYYFIHESIITLTSLSLSLCI